MNKGKIIFDVTVPILYTLSVSIIAYAILIHLLRLWAQIDQINFTGYKPKFINRAAR